ncbi:hypothetical protein ACOSQ3_005695 [Xanthoceras sorbifolium]
MCYSASVVAIFLSTLACSQELWWVFQGLGRFLSQPSLRVHSRKPDSHHSFCKIRTVFSSGFSLISYFHRFLKNLKRTLFAILSYQMIWVHILGIRAKTQQTTSLARIP